MCKKKLQVIQSFLLSSFSQTVSHGFTARLGGYSLHPYTSLNLGLHVGDNPEHVVANRELVCDKLDFSLSDWVSGEQVHNNNVAVVTRKDRGKGAFDYESSLSNVDALITKDGGILLAGMFADCVPILFFDPNGPIIGLAHAGWKGTLGYVALETVKLMQNVFGSDPKRINAWLGPSIKRCCYEVSQELADRFCNLKSSENSVTETLKMPHLDLAKINRNQLIYSGIKEENIEVTDDCTMCRSEIYFSHRNDGKYTGRMAAFIGILPNKKGRTITR